MIPVEQSVVLIQIDPIRVEVSPTNLHKLLKAVVVQLRRLGIRLIIYLDDMILSNQSRESLENDKDLTIWLLQQLGFVVNWEKANLIAQQCVVYMGFTINSLAMTLALHNIQQECQNIVDKSICSVRALSRLIGKLTASVMAVLPAPLHYRRLQMQKTRALFRGGQKYNTMLILTPDCLEEIRWWLYYLKDWHGRAIITPVPNLIITSDASMKGWGSACNGVTTQGMWNQQEQSLHINTLDVEPTGAITPYQYTDRSNHSISIHWMRNKQEQSLHINTLDVEQTGAITPYQYTGCGTNRSNHSISIHWMWNKQEQSLHINTLDVEPTGAITPYQYTGCGTNRSNHSISIHWMWNQQEQSLHINTLTGAITPYQYTGCGTNRSNHSISIHWSYWQPCLQ